jgi:hypothetical protein
VETPDQNLALQDELYKLRSETKDAFDEAKALEARWAELQREQKEVYQVRCHRKVSLTVYIQQTTAIHSPIPPHAPPACNDGAG